MEIQVPTWLDADYVEKVMQEYENDKTIKVSNVTVQSGTGKGWNFSSDIYRINFEFSRIHDGSKLTDTRSLICKTASAGNTWKKMLMDSGVFQTEISLFSETLPVINDMLADVGVAPLTPRCLYTQKTEPIHLTFDDLEPGGYRMAENSQNGLDLNHSLLAMKNLGVFHGTSVALVDKDPMAPMLKHTKRIYDKDQPAMFIASVNMNIKALGEEVAKWPELNPRISEKILKFSDAAYEKACEACRFRAHDFNVLNHGDFSEINIMFRYDERQRPVGLKFLDFQFSNYGSPAIDILYFFGLSTSADVRMNHRDELLREYHSSLISTMAELKCTTKAPSFAKLEKILEERAHCEVLPSLTILAFVRSDTRFTKSMVSNVEDHKAGQCDYQGKLYRKIMTRLLPLYDSTGLLDL